MAVNNQKHDNLLNPKKMITEINLDCGNFKIYKDYMIGTMNEGVAFDEVCKNEIWKICQTHFKDKPFGYISNRVNSYSVDPTIYLDTSGKFAKMKAMAVVTQRKMQRLNVQLERQFFKAELEVFESIEEGKAWIEKVLNYTKSNSLST